MLLLLVVPGLVALAGLVRAGDRAALLAVSFTACATVSALTSDRPVLALTGAANLGTGLLFVLALVGAWALAATAGPRRRRQLASALVAGAVANAVVAWLQARSLVPPALDSPGRAAGLMGQVIHLGTLSAAALWLVGHRLGRRRGRLVWLVPFGLLAGAAQLSGGRSAVGLALVSLVATVRGAGRARAVAMVAAATVGVLAAPAGADGVVVGTARAVGDEATAQVDVRFGLWWLGLDAALERPVLGWAPGRFQEATSPRTTAEVAETGTTTWKDAHNWVVEYAVTTGGLGLASLGAWLAVAARRGRGPLCGFALVVGLASLVEPLTVGLTPLALLALGASAPAVPAERPPGGGWAGAVSAAGVAAALAVGGVLVAGDVLLRQGLADASVGRFERGRELLPPWPEVSRLGSRIAAFHGLGDEHHRRRALALAEEATRRDPHDPSSWSYLGLLELRWGTEARAATALRRSLEENPWLASGLVGTARLAEARGDRAQLAASCARLRSLGHTPTSCRRAATLDP